MRLFFVMYSTVSVSFIRTVRVLNVSDGTLILTKRSSECSVLEPPVHWSTTFGAMSSRMPNSDLGSATKAAGTANPISDDSTHSRSNLAAHLTDLDIAAFVTDVCMRVIAKGSQNSDVNAVVKLKN